MKVKSNINFDCESKYYRVNDKINNYQTNQQNSDESDQSVYKWPPNTLLITSDSTFNNLDEKRLNKHNYKTKVRCFPGSTISDMYHYITPLLKKEPDHILLHVGTNDSTSMTSDTIVDELLLLKHFIQGKLPNSVIILSQPTIRHDNAKATLTINRVIEK